MVQYDLTERCNNPEKFILIRRISKVLFLVLFAVMNVGHFFENRIPYSAHNAFGHRTNNITVNHIVR